MMSRDFKIEYAWGTYTIARLTERSGVKPILKCSMSDDSASGTVARVPDYDRSPRVPF